MLENFKCAFAKAWLDSNNLLMFFGRLISYIVFMIDFFIHSKLFMLSNILNRYIYRIIINLITS